MSSAAQIHGTEDNLPLSAQGLDEFEAGLLPVLRYLLLGYEQPESHSWHHAFIVASERWGDAVGLPAAHALTKVIRALLEARAGVSYADPFDLDARQMVTADEAALLRMLHHMRRDETPAARDAVEAVTLGRMDPHVIRAGLAFACRFSCGRQGSRAAPQLRVVK